MAVGKPERATQNRVINLFQGELGYRYLGDWTDRAGNSNIEEELLRDYLQKNGYSTAQINRTWPLTGVYLTALSTRLEKADRISA